MHISNYRRRVGYPSAAKAQAPEGWVKLPALEPSEKNKETMRGLKNSHGIKYCHLGDRENQGWYCSDGMFNELIELMPKERPIPKKEWIEVSYEALDKLKALGYDKPNISWRPIINPNITSDPEV